MKARARIRLTFDDAARAQEAADAAADADGGSLRIGRRGRTVTVEAPAAAPMDLLRSLDACLAAVSAAERAAAPARPRGRTRRRRA